jgi:molecular chaperone HscB
MGATVLTGGHAMVDKPLTLASNDFELFAVPARFAQDAGALDARWKELQREAHPDRFAAQGVAAQRQAMQWSVRINEAYQRLRHPLKRAAYLCELAGAPINAENNTAMPAQFLIEQMQWREALDEARSEADVTRLLEQVNQARTAALQHCEELLDVRRAPDQAVGQVRALMFIERFSHDVQARLDDFQNPPAVVAGTSGQAT